VNEPIPADQWKLSPEETAEFLTAADRARGRGEAGWKAIQHQWLSPQRPFAMHLWAYQQIYGEAALRENPQPVWFPTKEQIGRTHVGKWCLRHECDSVSQLHLWSVRHREEFWQEVIDELEIPFDRLPHSIWDIGKSPTSPVYLPGATMNIAESCFLGDRDRPAVIFDDEEGRTIRWSLGRLQEEVQRVAGALTAAGFGRGSRAAVMMPMTPEAVAIYLGVIWAGGAVVAIADSFAAPEIATRLEITRPELLFVQGEYVRAGKTIDLYRRMLQIDAPPCVVVGDTSIRRPEDQDYGEWISGAAPLHDSVPCSPMDATNYLFSSGTTGTPKAIPWTHSTPIKCAADARFHQDVHAGDRLAWPTNLGWMMGPWLIYAALVNRATIALYGGSPAGRSFAEFVQDQRITMLGVVPSLIRAWRENETLEGLDWSHLHCFSSTGECSQPEDMLYLMSRAGYRPMIEYCGGTELAGGYISATLAVPCAPSVFTTPAFGLDFVILDESGTETSCGEAFLVPPSLGMSTTLLNRDHYEAYYSDVPKGPGGVALRRHGDRVEQLGPGRYRVLGRADDTMNLGGIKVSSAEIERVVTTVAGIREAAAVAVPPPGGGPSQLVVFAVAATDQDADAAGLGDAVRSAIRSQLNPLFKMKRLVLVEQLPRTASNKVMRRLLREKAVREEEPP